MTALLLAQFSAEGVASVRLLGPMLVVIAVCVATFMHTRRRWLRVIAALVGAVLAQLFIVEIATLLAAFRSASGG